jgi:hypothetical protein
MGEGEELEVAAARHGSFTPMSPRTPTILSLLLIKRRSSGGVETNARLAT